MVQWVNENKGKDSIIALAVLIVMSVLAAYVVASLDYSVPKITLSLQVLAKFSFLLALLIIVEFVFTGKLAFKFENYNVVGWIFQACLVINLWFAANRKWK
jgi:hypothetical protein